MNSSEAHAYLSVPAARRDTWLKRALEEAELLKSVQTEDVHG